MNKKMIIIGASGHGKVIEELIKENGIDPCEYLDDFKKENQFRGKRIVRFQEIENNPNLYQFIIAIGNNAVRKNYAEKHATLTYTNAIGKHTKISPSATIGVGNAIMNGVTINADVSIGNHCIINTNASIDHDCIINDYVHISPNVALAGNVTIGVGTHIGIGSSVMQGIKIGKNCIIGAGAAVIRDLPDNVTAVGVPAKIIKTNQNHE